MTKAKTFTALNVKLKMYYSSKSTAVEQTVACVPVTQRTTVRSPIGTTFLGEVFSGFFFTCKTNVREI